MAWQSWNEFFAMGGYGVYVWGSFAACAIGLCLEWVLIKQHRRGVVKHLRRLALVENCRSDEPQALSDSALSDNAKLIRPTMIERDSI